MVRRPSPVHAVQHRDGSLHCDESADQNPVNTALAPLGRRAKTVRRQWRSLLLFCDYPGIPEAIARRGMPRLACFCDGVKVTQDHDRALGRMLRDVRIDLFCGLDLTRAATYREMRVVDVQLSVSLEMVEASPSDYAGDPTRLSRRIRFVRKPDRARFYRNQHLVLVEDRSRLAQLDASVQTTVDAQPSVLGHFRLEKVNLFRENLLETEDVRVDGSHGLDHKLFAHWPDVIAVLSNRRSNIECHHLEFEGRVIRFCLLGKERHRAGTQHDHSQDMKVATLKDQRLSVF